MISFIINAVGFIKIIIQGLRKDKEFRFLLIFIILLLFGSTIFYTKVEHWTVIDALYFSIMTMATVGYGDLAPTTDISKLFTIIYTVLSIGGFVSFTAKFVQMIFVNHQNKKERIQQKFKARKSR